MIGQKKTKNKDITERKLRFLGVFETVRQIELGVKEIGRWILKEGGV